MIHVGVAFTSRTTRIKVINGTVITVDDEVLNCAHSAPVARQEKRISVPFGTWFIESRRTIGSQGTLKHFRIRSATRYVPIVEKLPSKAQVLYLEQELERRLNIEPEAVAGEYAARP